MGAPTFIELIIMGLKGPIELMIICFAYVFWPQPRLAAEVEKTRLDYLRERKEVIYDNLRDLNFEYRAGKYPEEDFTAQRSALEAEAATVLAEMDAIILHLP
jgi:hypothetical protein